MAVKAIAKGFVSVEQVNKEVELFGVKFRNPVGLAAGFDKDGVAVSVWHKLGFGFVEIGTVTRHAQPGNPAPRLFRLPESKGLINRMGFNNEGADAMGRRLELAEPMIPVGINIGKSKVTPLEEAADDYLYSFRRLGVYGDYFVVNVSSPNTPGLRELQQKDHLERILGTLREADPAKPLFVKIAPDLTLEQLDEAAETAIKCGLTGMIATNTTLSRAMLPRDPQIEGGLSGAPVRELADASLAHLNANYGDQLTLIGVGGIMTPDDAKHKMELGAKLVQVYTGWIYGGPKWVPQIVHRL